MATETLNYKFIKDDPNEDYDVARVNANLDKIDAEIKAVDDKVEAVEQSIGNIKIPVKSVNGKTGEVELTAGDVGAETPEGVSAKANAAASAALGVANQYTDQEVGKVSTQMAELTPKTDFNAHKADNVGHGTATKAEAQVGTSHASYMTPLRTKEAIQALQAISSVAGKTGAVTVTKSDVNLGNVENYGIATQAEAEAGTSNVKYMTPLRVKEAITKEGAIKYAAGSYIGDGVSNRTINLGVQPKKLILYAVNYNNANTAYYINNNVYDMYLYSLNLYLIPRNYFTISGTSIVIVSSRYNATDEIYLWEAWY